MIGFFSVVGAGTKNMTHTTDSVTYTHKQWLANLTKSQAIRWLQTNSTESHRIQCGVAGRLYRVLRRHTLDGLRKLIRDQWVNLVFVLPDRTVCWTARPQTTILELKKVLIEDSWSEQCPTTLAEFVLQDSGPMDDWRTNTVFQDHLTLQECQITDGGYLYCRRQLDPRKQRSLVRERLHEFDAEATEWREWSETVTGPEPGVGWGPPAAPLTAGAACSRVGGDSLSSPGTTGGTRHYLVWGGVST